MVKRPDRDHFLLKERFKLESEVFDKQTLMLLSSMMSKGTINNVDYPISTGKEANVFRATTPSGSLLAVKIYKIETTHFMNRKEYMFGDPRFKKFRRNERDLVNAFAQKEFKNLQICEKAGVHSPRPLLQVKNILVMEFLGEEGLPYTPLNTLGPESIDQLKSILKDVKKMYEAGLVHADLSEYNILVGPVPYLIDFGQGVILAHPNAEKYLERDVRNILMYFSKYGFEIEINKALGYVKGEEKRL